MVAAKFERTEAFDCLMKYMMNIEGANKNLLFKVLALKADLVLKVMLYPSRVTVTSLHGSHCLVLIPFVHLHTHTLTPQYITLMGMHEHL